VRVKICGVTTPDDARVVAMLGADAVGLNFYPPSPRFVNVDRVVSILDSLPPFVTTVGVCVNNADIIWNCAWHNRLDMIQWHGEDRPSPIVCWLPLIVGFAVRGPESLDDIRDYVGDCRLEGRLPVAILLDAHVPGQHGGTGQTAPWDLLAGFDPGVPLILAGGLTPDNVAEAIRRVRPYAVDVASGVESSPGRKDLDKVRRFIDNARSA
jgi:phosphoribosylanthranilate isomerase